jgi:hypothetical protein
MNDSEHDIQQCLQYSISAARLSEEERHTNPAIPPSIPPKIAPTGGLVLSTAAPAGVDSVPFERGPAGGITAVAVGNA